MRNFLEALKKVTQAARDGDVAATLPIMGRSAVLGGPVAPCVHAVPGGKMMMGCGQKALQRWICTLAEGRAGMPRCGWPESYCGAVCKHKQEPQSHREHREQQEQKHEIGIEREKEEAVLSSVPSVASRSLKLAPVITAFDEGDEVRKTVESLAGSIKGEQTSLRPIVVDDGSKDGSCEWTVNRSQQSVVSSEQLLSSPPCVAGFAEQGTTHSRPGGQASLLTVRHDMPQGVGISRNVGTKAALDAGADAVSFHDAHMRFPDGVLEALADKAIETGAIVCSKARGWWYAEGDADVVAGKKKAGEEHDFRAWGADLHWNALDGFQPKYRIYVDNQAEWTRVPCAMGACYVMSRETIKRLMEPTGRLWEDVAGRWGFSEQALAVKAFLLDIPILVSRDLQTHHHYKEVNPVPNAGTEIWRNVCFAMAALLSKETFNQRFLRYCQIRLGEKETERLYEEAQALRDGDVAATRPLVGTSAVLGGRASVAERPWDVELHDGDVAATRPPVGSSAVLGGGASVAERPWDVEKERRIFTDLCGRSAPITGPHPEHAWLKDLPSPSPLPSGEGKGEGTNRSPLCILQWRPGESTLMLKRRFPDAQIKCLEWEKHRISNWTPILQDLLGVSLLRLPLESWADPTASGHVKKNEQFDLITIGGEMQEECRSAAERLAGIPGTRIVINPTADRLQIADEYRKEATDALKAFLKQGRDVTQINAEQTKTHDKIVDIEKRLGIHPHPTAASVTVLLLNWQRPENIGPILDCLAQQTVKPKIVLWNNGDPINVSSEHGTPMPLERHPLMSLVVQSMSNLGCMPRWWLASLADTDFVCSLDDDLVLADERVLEDAIEAQRTLCPDGIVGFFGWEAMPGKDYLGAKHINGSIEDRRVDVIKGRFMVFQTRLLQRVLLVHPALTLPSPGGGGQGRGMDLLRRCDDIYLSFCIALGERGRHLIPGVLGKRWKEIGRQDGRGLALQPGHYQERDRMASLMMNHYWGETRKGA